jgi:hypothetical protein
MKKLWTGHKKYLITDYVNLCVTLTLEVGTQVLCMTYHLIIVTICAEYFQNPFINEGVMDRTQNIPYIRLC